MKVLARNHNLGDRHPHDTPKLSSMPLVLMATASKRLPTWETANSNQRKLADTTKTLTSMMVSLLVVTVILTCFCGADNQTNAQPIDKLAGTSVWSQMKAYATANNDKHQIPNLNSEDLSGANFREAQSFRSGLGDTFYGASRQALHSDSTLKDFAHKVQAKAEPLSRLARSAARDHSGSQAQYLKRTAPQAAPISTAATTTPDVNLSTTTSEFVTVNYNGLIGVNGTDPYAITTESRTLSLPTEIQVGVACVSWPLLGSSLSLSKKVSA